MEKSKIKNLKIRLKAGVLTAVALIPGVSCGRNVGKQEPGANVSIETEANTEKNTSNIITTTTTKGNKTTTNTFVTEPTNNNGYVNNNKNNGHVDNTTNNNTNSTEAKTENKTNPTHQNTTQKTTTVKIKNSDIKVTTTKAHTQKPTTQKPVQTTAKPTTQKPVETTTVKVTEPPVTTVPYQQRNYNIEDITSDDALAARWAMQQYAEELRKELFNGYYVNTQYGKSDGIDESFALIGVLNYNQGINHRGFGNIFGYETEEYFAMCTDCLDLAYYQYAYGSKVDFNKYVIDKDFANFINRVSDEFAEYMNGNTEPLENELSNYFENNSVDIDNYAKYFFMRCTQNPYNLNAPEVEEARQMYFDNVAIPTFHKVKDNAIKVITR